MKLKSAVFFTLFFLALFTVLPAQSKEVPSEVFWKNLEKHCGRAYEGTVTSGGKEGDGFMGERLVMQVLSCEPNRIRIPFYVGNDKSRTWVLFKNENNILA